MNKPKIMKENSFFLAFIFAMTYLVLFIFLFKINKPLTITDITLFLAVWLFIFILYLAKSQSLNDKGKDSFEAKFAFCLSLGFLIPLFNMAICPISFWMAVKAMKKIGSEPKKFGGKGYALAAIILSVTSI